MTCDEASILMHAQLDGELDVAHARELDAHLAGCAHCAAEFNSFRAMRANMRSMDLGFAAPAELRSRINRSVPSTSGFSRRSLLSGFAAGGLFSGAVAAGLVALMVRNDHNTFILDEALSAHLRSLQGDHLIDVISTDQHTVKPWFNGRVDFAPPVADLSMRDFTLAGGRLDYIEGKPVAALVYRRRAHVINLFIGRNLPPQQRERSLATVQGFNTLRWLRAGLDLIAVSDINAQELAEFAADFDAASQ
jgi:anti-sigma factor RsiW